MSRLAPRLVVLAGTTLLLVGLLELGARAWVGLAPPPDTGFPDDPPPPYAGADFYGPEMLSEARTCLRRTRPEDRARGAPRFGDFAGRYVNVADGLRMTTDRGKRFAVHALFLGGSTVFSRRVPDEHTIPSSFQRLVNQRLGGRYRVVNLGIPGADVAGQWRELEGRPVGPGDLVVFYDGVNDVTNPLIDARSAEPAERVTELGARERLLERLRPLARKSVLIDLLLRDEPDALPGAALDRSALERLYDERAAALGAAVRAAHDYVRERDGRFVHVLQPALPLHELRTAWEDELLRRDSATFPELELAYRIAYPRFRASLAEAALAGVETHDLSRILEERSGFVGAEVEVYFDRSHVNHVANSLLARALFERIFPGRR